MRHGHGHGDGHLARIRIAIGMALGSLNIYGGCGPCGDNVVTTPLVPMMNGPDSATEPLPPVGPKSAAECAKLCTQGTSRSCRVYLDEAGTAEILECVYFGQCGAGRRPAGLVVRGGAVLARMAALEAASVDAFRILERELASHGAPKTMLSSCRRAARDEARHARTMDALARRSGARRCRVTKPQSRRRRSLVAIAKENAREGCVGEAWGALLAQFQATTATDPVVRATMEKIAKDEARHAALSFAVDAWIARKRHADLSRTKRSHAKRILREVAKMPGSSELGLPNGRDAVRLATALFSSLGWI